MSNTQQGARELEWLLPTDTSWLDSQIFDKSGCERRQNLIFINIKLIYIVILIGNKFCNKKIYTPDFFNNMKT